MQNWSPYVCLQNILQNFIDTSNSKFWEPMGGTWDFFLPYSSPCGGRSGSGSLDCEVSFLSGTGTSMVLVRASRTITGQGYIYVCVYIKIFN